MGVESPDDLAVFVNPDEFGAVASYRPADGSPIDGIAGIFDRAAETVGESTAYLDTTTIGVTSTKPLFHCRTADLPSDASDGDEITVTVDGEVVGTFVVRVVEHDGTGMTILTLEVA